MQLEPIYLRTEHAFQAMLVSTWSLQRRRNDFLIGGAQSETTHRVVSNLYNNL